ncbi:hypothetical protein ATANTOWER_025389 [Ataeniobius toweri]|uniref:Uncharacterized protein n=1 Tax=Ataeniobius toweri TaxID=208326 RepID=A0ABU7C9Z1_9TELE|nr:hypothetical protein [Ataeniobius toweri]
MLGGFLGEVPLPSCAGWFCFWELVQTPGCQGGQVTDLTRTSGFGSRGWIVGFIALLLSLCLFGLEAGAPVLFWQPASMSVGNGWCLSAEASKLATFATLGH